MKQFVGHISNYKSSHTCLSATLGRKLQWQIQVVPWTEHNPIYLPHHWMFLLNLMRGSFLEVEGGGTRHRLSNLPIFSNAEISNKYIFQINNSNRPINFRLASLIVYFHNSFVIINSPALLQQIHRPPKEVLRMSWVSDLNTDSCQPSRHVPPTFSNIGTSQSCAMVCNRKVPCLSVHWSFLWP